MTPSVPSQVNIKKGKALLKYWREVTGLPVNVTRDHWGFTDMIEVYEVDEVKALIDYFVELNNGENIKWFYDNYDTVDESMQARNKDRADIAALKKQTEERVKNWKLQQQENNSK